MIIKGKPFEVVINSEFENFLQNIIRFKCVRSKVFGVPIVD